MKPSNHFALKNNFIIAIEPGDPTIVGYWFIFHGHKLLMDSTAPNHMDVQPFSPATQDIEVTDPLLFGYYDSTPCFLATVPESHEAASMTPMGLRALFGATDEDYFSLAGRALQILHHNNEHRFCSKCATPMENREGELARVCPACGFITFPRVSPAVIMSIVKDDHILLGRGAHFAKGMYSTLAGFVEAGETLEEAVAREVFEETAISVEEVAYMSSQPWPFPHSVMIGFTGKYAGGRIQVDKSELEDARWFHYRDLPRLPSRITIARLLIDNFLSKAREKYD